MELDEYKAAFDTVNREFEDAVESFGLPFEKEQTQNRLKRGLSAGIGENCNKSIRGGNTWISPACIACRTGEKTITFFISLRCPKNCYFCFNPNQQDYERYCQSFREATQELKAAHKAGAQFDCIALTGGEPLLHFDRTIDFFKCVQDLYPKAHTRLYTSGHGLDKEKLLALQKCGLQEIRFSIKLEDSAEEQLATKDLMYAAIDYIPDVMVEMPVIPGTLAEMKQLLVEIADKGLRGINLLEFCFPLANAQAFKDRGFTLRKQPYDVLYNYWYAGGVPIAGSEAEALELVRFAEEKSLDLGVHYCSSDNKNTGQLYQQNYILSSYQAARKEYLEYHFDETDYFIKCAKVFGKDVTLAKSILDGYSSSDGAVRYSLDDGILIFSTDWVEALLKDAPGITVGISLNVLEPSQDGLAMHELDIQEVSI